MKTNQVDSSAKKATTPTLGKRQDTPRDPDTPPAEDDDSEIDENPLPAKKQRTCSERQFCLPSMA